jgi:hypothetical protein
MDAGRIHQRTSVMSIFTVLIVIGLTGMLVMALPGMARQGHMGAGHSLGHGAAHGAAHSAGGHAASHTGHAGQAAKGGQQATTGSDLMRSLAQRLIPSPVAVFSFLTLYGALGTLIEHTMRQPRAYAALLALLPALLAERTLVTPMWNLVVRSEGEPSTPLENLVMQEAKALTPFANGKGLVSVVRDGRAVQFVAQLTAEQAGVPVRVGDVLQIEDVDPHRQRLTVAIR